MKTLPTGIRTRACCTLAILAVFASSAVLLTKEADSVGVTDTQVQSSVQIIASEDLNQLTVTRDGKGFAALLDVRVLDDDGKEKSVKAQTGSDGRLPVEFVPRPQWQSASAFSGSRLSLPGDAFGTVQFDEIQDVEVLRGTVGAQFGSAPDRGVVNIVTRKPFAAYQGRFVDSRKYALDLVSPFSLLCRSDEGLPGTLADGDRFTYEVGEAGLKQVLGQRFVINPYSFRLPDGGYSVTSAGGAAPRETWTALEGLAKSGLISRLERDPCWEFLPNGRTAAGSCEPGVRDFPDKAFRLSGGFGSMLRSPYQKTAIADAFVWYGPLSPTPFYDPGYRDGDDRPPTFVRTGGDGGYRALLNGLSGPIEIGVAKGCNEHTTVAIAEGPGTQTATIAGLTTQTRTLPGAPGTTTRTPDRPVTLPPDKPVASKPREKPDPSQKICGPDVTDYVLGVLQMMEDSYKSWDAAERSRRCSALYSLRSFNYAWDMQGFTPSDDTEPGKKPGEPGYMEYIFFQRSAPGYCAVPHPPCGATVQFFGHCIHAQIVNYVQWGMVNQQCDSQLSGIMANMVRSGFSKNYPGQEAMSLLGATFGMSSLMPSHVKKTGMKLLLDGLVARAGTDWGKMDGTDCALLCDKIAPEAKGWLDNMTWGFAWGAGFDNIPITARGNTLKKP